MRRYGSNFEEGQCRLQVVIQITTYVPLAFRSAEVRPALSSASNPFTRSSSNISVAVSECVGGVEISPNSTVGSWLPDIASRVFRMVPKS
jgi:hypothetical protein